MEKPTKVEVGQRYKNGTGEITVRRRMAGCGAWAYCEEGKVDYDWTHDGACCWFTDEWFKTATYLGGPNRGEGEKAESLGARATSRPAPAVGPADLGTTWFHNGTQRSCVIVGIWQSTRTLMFAWGGGEERERWSYEAFTSCFSRMERATQEAAPTPDEISVETKWRVEREENERLRAHVAELEGDVQLWKAALDQKNRIMANLRSSVAELERQCDGYRANLAQALQSKVSRLPDKAKPEPWVPSVSDEDLLPDV